MRCHSKLAAQRCPSPEGNRSTNRDGRLVGVSADDLLAANALLVRANAGIDEALGRDDDVARRAVGGTKGYDVAVHVVVSFVEGLLVERLLEGEPADHAEDDERDGDVEAEVDGGLIHGCCLLFVWYMDIITKILALLTRKMQRKVPHSATLCG